MILRTANAQTSQRFRVGLSEHSLFAYKEGNTMYAQNNDLNTHCIDAHACYKKAVYARVIVLPI